MPNDFDIPSKNYDSVFTFSEIGKAQRQRVYHFASKYINPATPLDILELNCGTGEDAIYFSEKGHRVLATDISEGMIQHARAKGNGKVQFQQMDINTISESIFQQKFDLVFSNFGGLNCLSPQQLKKFLKTLPSLVKPNGKIIMVIMPKSCLWEQFYFLVKGSSKKAFRRKKEQPSMANVEGIEVPTWYYNPKDIVTLCKEVDTVSVHPIGIAIPPSYLEPFFASKKRILRTLTLIEGWLKASFWAKYADHYIITFQKK